MRNPFKRYCLNDLQAVQSNLQTSTTILEKRALAKICVIDDQGFPPIDNLNDSGFKIYFLGNINDVRKTEEFPLVLCDIKGVALKISTQNQGAALINEIKKHYPEKIVIVYTGSSTRSTLVKGAINEADNYIPKSADIEQWVNVLDNAISEAFDPVEQWRRVRAKLVSLNVPAKDVAKIEHSYSKSFVTGTKRPFEKRMGKFNSEGDIRPILQNLAAAAIWALVAS